MTENRTPTEQELDALLDRQPPFDLEAVKIRTLSRIGEQVGQPVKRRAPLRCFLIAAVICALSVSAVAAADYVTAGRLSAALGIRKPAAEQVSEPEPTLEDEMAPVHVEKPSPAPKPEPEPEPPELDAQIASALQVSQGHAQRLRPAVQAVDQTAEDQDVRMTVLQTLGDPSCLYVKLRFDFPEEVAASEYLEFDTFNVSFENADGYGWQEDILERTDRSITCLLTVKLYGQEDLNGQAVTVTVENYGTPHRYTEDEIVQLAGEAGKPYTTIIDPNGTVRWDITEADLASMSPEKSAIAYPEGFTVSVKTDGSKVVTYDGEHGDQMLTAYLVPDFDAVVAGTWEQSWTLQYEDLSLYWEGDTELFDPRLTLTGFRLSPLSWSADFTATEDVPVGETLNFNLIPRDWGVQLRRRDGSLADQPLHWSVGSGSSPVPNEAGLFVTVITVGNVFDQPIDISDVTAVIIDGQEFPVN